MRQKNLMNFTTSAVATNILPKGKTDYSTFQIKIQKNEDSTCNISEGSDTAQTIQRTDLIIWD